MIFIVILRYIFNIESRFMAYINGVDT